MRYFCNPAFDHRLAWLMAFCWGLLPMFPALWTQNIAGSPYTDLYPSIWSLWATEDWLHHFKSTWLNYPQGQSWYPSNLLWGILCIPFKSWLSMGTIYNIILFVARFAGAISFYYAGFAQSQNRNVAWLFMILIGCSPFVHGFAVEGILEGCQIWGIALWLWSIAKNKYKLASLFFFATILSNWYFAAVLSTLCFWMGWQNRKIWYSFWGLLPSIPFIYAFLASMDGHQTIPPEIRQSMGFQWGLPTPNILEKPSIFAINSYIGFISLAVMFHQRNIRTWNSQKWAALMLFFVSLLLASGWSPLYEQPFLKPLLGFFRFPYRWHLLLLIALALFLQDHPIWKSQRSWIVLGFIFMEQSLLSSISCFIPVAPAKVDNYVQMIDGPILDLPGPKALPPGTPNPSRQRLKYILYNQTFHQQPIGWSLDFNSLHSINSCFQETHQTHRSSEDTLKVQNSAQSQCWNHIEWVVIHNQSTEWNDLLQSHHFQLHSQQSNISVWKKKHVSPIPTR